MLFMPPRHGKSETATIRFPVYCIEKQPTTRFIIGAYNSDLAIKFSRRSRSIARERFALSNERSTAADWETPQGGGMRAVGVGGGVTGHGANVIIIDDPIKSFEEASSLVYRDKVWNWYTNDIYTRREPDASMILIQTRWHMDDLAGRILSSEDAKNWTVVLLPAEAEADDPLGRVVGEALCPERFDLNALAEIKTVLGSNRYAALYQQRPVPAEGGLFKRRWFGEPLEVLPSGGRLARYWDSAATDGGGDYTVGALMAKLQDRFFVADIERGQWSPGTRDQTMLRIAKADQERYGYVKYFCEQEPGASGVSAVSAFVKMLAGFSAHGRVASGNKEVRAEPLAAQAEIGNVKLIRGVWVPAYLDELCSFPQGTHDDQVDASSGAFNELAGGKSRNPVSW